MTNGQPRVWDRYAISAEVKRRGMTLTGIAKEAGLFASACRGCLSERWSLAGAQALSRALEVPVEELFPHRFRSPQQVQPNRTTAGRPAASQKARRATDSARVA